MSQNLKKCLSFLLAPLFVLQSCTSELPAPRWEMCDQVKEVETEKKSPETSNYLIVYLDTSASLSGYIAEKGKHDFAIPPDDETIYSKTLLELGTTISSLDTQPQILLRKVSDNISDPTTDDLSISRASFSRNIYDGQETNLAGAIGTFNQPLERSSDKKIPRLHILVTDGVQSSNKQNEATACENGSDWRCVRNHIRTLLNAGWSGSILGIKSEFQGKIFSELKKGNISYDSEKKIDKLRPFYLYIMSPVRADAEKLIESLKKRLSEIAREKNISQEKLFREYPLAVNFSEKKLISQSEIDELNAKYIEVIQEEQDKAQFTVKVSAKTEIEGRKPFDIKVKIPWTGHALNMDNPEELFKLTKWKIDKVSLTEVEDHRYPELEITGQSFSADGFVTIKLSAGWRNEVRKKDWRMYRITGTINSDSVPSWVRDWSTKDDTLQANGNKTLNLESSLAKLWESSALNDYVVAEVCLRVGAR